MHKNVKGTRKIPEVCTSGIFRLKIAQKRKTPEKFKFFGSLWGFFVCSDDEGALLGVKDGTPDDEGASLGIKDGSTDILGATDNEGASDGCMLGSCDNEGASLGCMLGSCDARLASVQTFPPLSI